jgi:hypothetical protein
MLHYHTLRGRLRVRLLDKQGHLVSETRYDNAIVDTGRVLIGQLLVGDAGATPISHLAVGTDTTAPTPQDTALGAEIVSIDRAPITVTPLADSADIGLRVSAQVSSATNQAVAEAGLFNAADHGAGVMYNCVVFPSALPVGTDLDLVFEWDITF